MHLITAALAHLSPVDLHIWGWGKADRKSGDLTKCYSLAAGGGVLVPGERRHISPKLLCCTKLLYAAQNTHGRAGSVSHIST